ncbi:unnamed protein product [Rhodiola kirilowii]
MGKIGGSSHSWLTAVKRAFKSPSKDTNGRRMDECGQDDEDDKQRRGKRRWGLWKSSCQETVIQCDGKNSNVVAPSSASNTKPATATLSAQMKIHEKADHSVSETVYAEQRQALAVAMASSAAAEAAVASAQAAVGLVRLTCPRPPPFVKKHYAAITIQTAFRGYLARRALRALKGLVKLQALVRGYSVRKRAKMTLQCMQALVRAQTRVQEQRRRLSHEGSRDSNSRWENHFVDRIRHARNASNVEDYWDEPRTILEVQSMMEKTKEAALKREKALPYTFSRQMLRSSRDSCASESEPEGRPRYVDHWRYDRTGRASCDHHRESLKTVHMDTSQPYTSPSLQRSQQQCYQSQLPSHYMPHNRIPSHSPRTPVSARIKHIQVNSASPRLQREEMSYPKAQTPNLGSVFHHGIQGQSAPNYMAATASAKARVRSHSVPRHMSEIQDGDKRGTVKKRLLFPVHDPNAYFEANNPDEDRARNFRTTWLPSQHGVQSFTEPKTNISSCCTDSNGEEMSPSSINNHRIWFTRQ